MIMPPCASKCGMMMSMAGVGKVPASKSSILCSNNPENNVHLTISVDILGSDATTIRGLDPYVLSAHMPIALPSFPMVVNESGEVPTSARIPSVPKRLLFDPVTLEVLYFPILILHVV